MPTILMRQQLYDRAWTTPINWHGNWVSLVASPRQALRLYDIPVTPRGYWAKKAFGKRVGKPPLPSPDTYGRRISFNGPARIEAADVANVEVHPLIAFEALPRHYRVRAENR
jgi:hypothetical protein